VKLNISYAAILLRHRKILVINTDFSQDQAFIKQFLRRQSQLEYIKQQEENDKL
jgi:hypothetical protein